jgi:cullin 3
VFELGIKLFGQEVFHKNTLERIQRLIMEIIRKDRDGEEVADRFLLKSLCLMMIEISKKDVYQPHFEKIFLNESRQYFTKEAAHFFDTTTATDYLKRVVVRLKEERERATRCMDDDTRAKIEDVLKQVMIDHYKNRIIEKEGSGCKIMLQEWRVDDLRLVFDVLSMVPGALDPCVDLVLNYCRSQGYEIVKDQTMEDKPLEMIEKLIKLKENYDDLLVRAFSTKKDEEIIRSPTFSKAMKTAFDDTVNVNDKLPEYLSLYVDSKLKKGKTQILESEFDLLFDQVIGLFRHLREKDIFETYYKKHLAKRLLSQRSQSDEAEKSFITKLKTEFGYQFTSKLEGMFTDMRTSRETMESYKTYIEYNSKPPIDLTVQILTTGYWPVQQSFNIAVPKVMEDTCNTFKDFYLHSHSGRKLTWQYNMGTSDIKANGYDKSYEINVSTFQAVILLLFNDHQTLTYGEIAQLTKIPTKDLKVNLLALTVKNATHEKVLNKDGGKTLDKDSQFSANNEFKSKLIKVKINPVVLKESSEQAKQTQEKVDEERKWQLDATIVRIMKARKTLEHRDLVVEVTKQLQHRFMPAPDFIKKRIESLIEREYLERDPNTRSKYNYMA